MGLALQRLSLVVSAAVLLLGVAWFAADRDPARALANCDTNSAALDSDELLMLQLVNNARAAVGAPSLIASPGLSRAAAWKSEDSSNQPDSFSHTDSFGRSPSQRAMDCGYPGQAGEDIAFGYPGTQATFDAFMGSPPHRANIENATYSAIGLGHSGNSWSLTFGFVDDSTNNAAAGTSSPTPTLTPTLTPTPTAMPTSTPPPPAAPANGTNVRAVTNTTELHAGLNIVTFDGGPARVPAAIQTIAPSVNWIYTWDGTHWLRYFPGAPAYINTLDVMSPGVVYFVSLSQAATWGY